MLRISNYFPLRLLHLSTFAKKILKMNFKFQNIPYQITRYPKTTDHALFAWNAADELMLEYANEHLTKESKISIHHDRFGILSTCLHNYHPQIVTLFHSQEKAIKQNLIQNNISIFDIHTPLDDLAKGIDYSFIKIPKSNDLFELYLQQISQASHHDSIVIAGFMTKYFSKQALTLAQKYFAEVSQSQAKKKARLLILKSPKFPKETNIIHDIKLDDQISFKQYYGVFSAKNIDYASQFLMEQMLVREEDKKILDLGCGNGILAWKARELSPTAKINLLDDHFLALESAKLNLNTGNNFFHYGDSLEKFTHNSFDLVISNPPFHFEYENNIDISLSLFSQVYDVLKDKGRFQLVANRHLNYQTHLRTIFERVDELASNDKFVVYSCEKNLR